MKSIANAPLRSREQLYTPPLPPFSWGQKAFLGGGGVVYFEAPAAGLYMPTPPTPRRVFSPGVLHSKDFFSALFLFGPIFVVFQIFDKVIFGTPIFIWFSVIFGNFSDFW